MIKFNIFTGTLDFSGGSQSKNNFPILMTDPLNPENGEPWVLVNLGAGYGNLLYFHGAMPVTEVASDDFLFSVKTPHGIKRVELT